MNKGFLNSRSKKNGVEELAESNVHESNAKKNDGIHMGKDGKPMHNPKEGPIKSILKRVTATVAGDNSLKSGFGDSLQHGSVIVEPFTIGNEALKQHGYIADLFKSTQQKSKKIVKVSHITTFEEINGADVAIPKVVVDKVREHFSNTLYGYFIGKRIPFLIVEKYVMNTWAKYGIERAIVRNGFYLFKFKTKEGMEQSSYARALIEMTSNRAFVESLVIGIPLDDGPGHSLETIDVEYEWKPPHCGVCKVFGHSPSSCPKRPMVDTNNSNKNSLKSDSKLEKKGTKSMAALTSRSLPGKSSTHVSNSFDTLGNLEEDGVNDPKGKNEKTPQSGFFKASTVPNDTYDSPKVTKAGGSGVSKTTKVPSTPFPKSARPECINESDIDEDDIVSSYGPSLGGGDQLEDEEFDFSDSYEAQVFDLPGQLKEFRDFRLSISGRK
nr:hypothetical protein [Tanacetum cinerariifolium]